MKTGKYFGSFHNLRFMGAKEQLMAFSTQITLTSLLVKDLISDVCSGIYAA